MNKEQQKMLLKIAAANIEAAVKGEKLPKANSDDPDFNQKQGCFVTIKNSEKLRGCIGQFVADKPLVEMIAEMAISASTNDPRFFSDKITEDELAELDIEISVLSPLEKTDNPLSLRLGIDGIYISKGYASGCFLPQVATETGWSKEEFLSYCCSHKAGLPPDAWKEPGVDVFLFSCDVFSSPYKNV